MLSKLPQLYTLLNTAAVVISFEIPLKHSIAENSSIWKWHYNGEISLIFIEVVLYLFKRLSCDGHVSPSLAEGINNGFNVPQHSLCWLQHFVSRWSQVICLPTMIALSSVFYTEK